MVEGACGRWYRAVIWYFQGYSRRTVTERVYAHNEKEALAKSIETARGSGRCKACVYRLVPA